MKLAKRAEDEGQKEVGDTEEEEDGEEGEKDPPYRAKTCSDCNRQFCMAMNLPICKGATDEDVKTACFRKSMHIQTQPCSPQPPNPFFFATTYLGRNRVYCWEGCLLMCVCASRAGLEQRRSRRVYFHHCYGVVTFVGAYTAVR